MVVSNALNVFIDTQTHAAALQTSWRQGSLFLSLCGAWHIRTTNSAV